jgi:hypothetical protein
MQSGQSEPILDNEFKVPWDLHRLTYRENPDSQRESERAFVTPIHSEISSLLLEMHTSWRVVLTTRIVSDRVLNKRRMNRHAN